MDKKFTNGAKRIFAAMLAVIIVSGGVPVSPFSQVFENTVITANAEDSWSKNETNTMFGTSGIEHPQAPQEDVEWRGNYVYYGKYDGNPMKYRVLDADSQEFVPRKAYPNNDQLQDPTQKTMFLESDSRIGSWNFGGQRDWDSSVLKRQLVGNGNLFLNKEGIFTSLERSSIFNSVKKSRSKGDKADGNGYDYGNYPANQLYYEGLWGDYIFVLDAVEATNPYYGYANTDDAHKSRDRGGYSWLRCTVCINGQIGNYAGAVYSDGSISHYQNRLYLPICPAFNIDLKKILFSSRISGDANAEYGKEYKLTLKDDKFGINVTNGQAVTYDGSTKTVTVPYTVTDNDDNIDPNTVSVLITDLNDNMVDYHSLSDTYSKSGTVSFTLPKNAPQNYHVYLLAENVNGIHETDYASQPVEIHVPTTYGISYVLNGGTNNPANPSTYIDDYGTEICAPTRDRYNFGGWYYDSAFSGDPVTNIPAGTTGRVKLYAKWIPCTYSVTLNKNGGTIVGEELTQYTYTYGAVLPEITRDYYTFKGWFVRDQYGNELKYTKISTSSYGDKSFYAKWTANTYSIGYELNGGTAANPTSYTAENLPITLNNPTRTGCTFTGWTGTDIAGTSQNVVISDCSAGNRTYTANWSVNHYTVKFDKNNDNATGTMADQNFTCNTEQTLTANGFTAPTGYHFAGWATSPNGNAVYTDEQPILNMTTEDNKEITLYAKWAANTYTIHFDANSDLAYGEMSDQVFTYDEALKEISANAFIFTTAEFLGWATSPDGDVVYTDKQQVRNLTTENDAVITLYAQWHRRYRINYDPSLFSCVIEGSPNNPYWAHKNDNVRINVTNPTVTYTFSVIDADGNSVAYNAETYTFTMPEKEVWITVSNVKKDISFSTITLDDRTSYDESAYLYNSSNPIVTPTVTVTNGDTVLTEGTDYTLEILNNTGSPDSMVEAVVLVTGKGDYYGTTTETFRITPFDIADCEIKGKFESYETGYGVDGPLAENVEIWNGDTKLEYYEDYNISIAEELALGEYEVGQTYHAIVTGCGDWGGTKTFEFELVKLYHTIVFDANGGTGTMPNDIATNGYSDCRYYLPECAFTAPYGYEFDYWIAECEPEAQKQPDDYFTAPTLWSEYDMQTITVTAHWKEKAKYTVTLPENMELISGIIDNDGKAYKDEVITFKAVDGYTLFGDVKVGDTVLTAENGIYTVTVTADTAVTATVLDNNTCYFDATTSTLHLRGNVTTADVQQYKDTALSVVAEKGTVLPEDSSRLFEEFTQATSINLANADTSNVTNMMYMFFDCGSLTSLVFSGFNTGSVTNMSCMFCWCNNLTSLDLSGFDTSSVTDMRAMFSQCNKLMSIDLSSFNTSSVTNMRDMFFACKLLTSLDLSSFNTSSVTNMYNMFGWCNRLTFLDLSSFDTNNVTSMGSMFCMDEAYTVNLTTVYVSENWNTDNVTDSEDMFGSCTKLKGGNGTTFDSNNVVDKTYAVIDGQDGQSGYLTGTYTLTLPNNMAIVTDASADKKVGGRYLNGAVVTFRYTGDVPEHHYVDVKAGYTTLTATNGVYTLTVTDNTVVSTEIKAYKYTVTLPNRMEIVGTAYADYEYGTAVSFKPKDSYIIKGDVTANGNVLTTDNGVYTLTVTDNMTVSANVDVESYFDSKTGTLTLKGAVLKRSGLGINSILLPNGVNKNNVLHIVVDNGGATLPEDSSWLFYSLENVTSIDLTRADTSSVQSMNSMFSVCQALTSLDLDHFNTNSVTDMSRMFYNCHSLETLDLSSFDTSNVENMESMFANDTNNSLTTIYVGKNWNTDSIATYTALKYDSEGNIITATVPLDKDMFENCIHLKGGNGTVYDSTKTDKTYARIDKDGQAGYMTGLYNLTLPEHMEIVTGAENKVGNRYLNNAVVTFKVKTGYSASNVKANDTDLTPDENGIYTITVTDDTEITADIVAYTPVVINSVDINGITTPTTVYKEIYASADYTVPANPYLDGYTFSGWKVNDGETISTPEAVHMAVYDLVKAGTPVTVEVVYEKKVGKHKVYVSAGTLENGETEFEYDISELVKITAYEGAEGQVFSYWERDGKAVSYNKTYSFYMPDGDVHLSAVYGNVQPAQATGFIENVTANADTRKISFVSVINVPENCTLVKGGLVATKNPDIGEAVTDKNAAFVKLSAKATADTKNLKYTWTKANVGENDIWYVRSYVVFIDTNNVEQTQYSDAVKAYLSCRITG